MSVLILIRGEGSGNARVSRSLFGREVLQKKMLGPGFNEPVVALARIALGALLLDKRLVKTEVVADGILPAAFAIAVPRKRVVYPFVDLRQSELFVGGTQNRHTNEDSVGVGRLGSIVNNSRQAEVVGRRRLALTVDDNGDVGYGGGIGVLVLGKRRRAYWGHEPGELCVVFLVSID